MSDEHVKTGSSSNSAGLFLRVRHPNGRTDEVYLKDGLSIGRKIGNNVVLADDEAVDRTQHALVDLTEAGAARLRCVGSDNKLSVGDTAVQEIGLTAGIRFRIGTTDFECVSGQKGSAKDRVSRGSTCPSCDSKSVPTPSTEPVPCPNCGQSILVLEIGAGYPSPLVIPVKYGEFLAEHYVARGGMGLVLRGRRKADNKPVAIKLLLPRAGVDRQATERFKQEITLMKRVSHANVVRLLSYGREGQFRFLIMEWVDGHNLRDDIRKLKQSQELPPFEKVLSWFEQVCKGLAAVHAVGIIHRDIKPSNILIAEDGHVLLSDLGVGKPADANQTALTTTGQLPGTYEYMAPEQLSAPDTVDQRTDLYALGVTFYELLTRERPVGAWPPASRINPTTPPSFDRILLQLLAPRPESRYSDIYEVLAAVADLKQPPTVPSGVGPVDRPPSLWSWIAEDLRLACTKVKAICITAIVNISLLVRIAAIHLTQTTDRTEASGTSAVTKPSHVSFWTRFREWAVAHDLNAVVVAVVVAVFLVLWCIVLSIRRPPQIPRPLEKEISVDLGNGVKLEMVLIPAGEFLMGSPDSDKDARDDEKPQHRVRITKPFYLGKYLVTQEQWEAVMGNNPSYFKGPKNPVEQVSWDDCQKFLEKVNAKVGTQKGGKFALPTEAQWEYACRAGSTTKYYFGDDKAQLGNYAWYDGNSDHKTHPVGEKKPNAWGLYDMHGNVAEWCQDSYRNAYDAWSPTDDPTGPATNSFRVFRDGGWNSVARLCRSADHHGDSPGDGFNGLGFRVLVPAEAIIEMPSTAPPAAPKADAPMEPFRPVSAATSAGLADPVTETFERGKSFFDNGDYDSAIAQYTEAIRLDPKYAAAYNSRSLAYGKKGEYDKAKADVAEAVRIGLNGTRN